MDRDDRAAAAKRRQAELRRVIDARSRDRELRRKQDRIEGEHRQLGPAKTKRVEVAVRWERRRVGRREIAEAQQCPFDVIRREARECREQVACVATDTANTGHRLQMARIEGDAQGT